MDHYQIRRVIDIYVSTKTEALQGVGSDINKLLTNTKTDKNTVLNLRGAVVSMNRSFEEFGVGLILAVLMVYLILMTQFTSFVDPFIILMAIPPGLAGVVMILLVTGSTLNIMSLMGVIMMTGIVVSNSILIVEFAGTLHKQGLPLLEAVVQSCKIRLRPILMTSLATLLGMIPMALGTEAGSEQYAPLGASGHRRPGSFGGRNRLSGSSGLPDRSWQAREADCDCRGGIRRMKRMKTRKLIPKFLFTIAIVCSSSLFGQTATATPQLPDAPQVSLVALAQQEATPMQQEVGGIQPAQADGTASGQHPRLTQSDAEKLAIKNNPRVSVARLLALAQHQVVRETRSAELPTGHRQHYRRGCRKCKPHLCGIAHGLAPL